MRKIFVIIMLALSLMTSKAEGKWEMYETKPDKVEQTPGETIFVYEDEEVMLFVNESTGLISIDPKKSIEYSKKTEYRNGESISFSLLTMAAFDLNQQRTLYCNDLCAMLTPDEKGLLLHEQIQIIGKPESVSEIRNYLRNKSGSVVFRIQTKRSGFIDIEIKTIKTLGYDDLMTGRHFDGDVDVLGL